SLNRDRASCPACCRWATFLIVVRRCEATLLASARQKSPVTGRISVTQSLDVARRG
ncbi:hypothetical protein A2U01_0076146, partial [Trifolium medium]|nr:hypothetical protein [Trifolium medium]